jgi:hypothetical protein
MEGCKGAIADSKEEPLLRKPHARSGIQEDGMANHIPSQLMNPRHPSDENVFLELGLL